MPSDVSNVKLGACSVTFGGTDLGYTKGGVEVEITTNRKQVTIDQFGETAVNDYITGRQVMVRVPLAEHDLATLVSVLPGATLVTDGVDATKMRIDVDSGQGTSLRDLAQALVLSPTASNASANEDFEVFLAAPVGDLSFSFRHDEERVYSIEFMGYVDTANGNQLFAIGDSTATA
jgi:hypothetical protein